jgi:hypothetical protein
MQSQSEKVPKALSETFTAITSITDRFCRQHLNDEYAQLIRLATAALCRKRPSPLTKGTPLSWAAGITHAVGMVNFLQDPDQVPHMPPQTLYRAFGVSQSNALSKSKATRGLLDMSWLDLEWCLPSRLHEHPAAWMVFTDNGMLVDARQLERQDQEDLHRAGLIPYIHADRAATSTRALPAEAPPAQPSSDEPKPKQRGEVPAPDEPPSPQLELF